jgi:hypothetical protein
MSIASQAGELLVAAAVGASSGTVWPIKTGRLLDTPDAQIALYDTPGINPNPKFLLDFPTFMVTVRGPKDDYEAAYNKIRAIRDVFLGMDPHNFGNGDRWDGVTGMGDINFLQWDDNSRPLFTANYRVIYEPASSVGSHRESL